ncbi:unnamed protein product, partial [Allacma fusca]
MEVEILGLKSLALLDTGSSISILGKQYIELIDRNNIKITKALRELTMASGSCDANDSVYLTISWPGGSRRQRFVLLPTLNRQMLLGRDFIIACNISLHLQEKGWTLGRDPQTLVTFDRTLSFPVELEGPSTLEVNPKANACSRHWNEDGYDQSV